MDSVLKPGTKVIVRSNENVPAWIGTLKTWYQLVGSEHPIVTTEQGDDQLCFSIVLPYTDEMWNFLNSMPNLKQWEIMSQLVLAIKDRVRHERQD